MHPTGFFDWNLVKYLLEGSSPKTEDNKFSAWMHGWMHAHNSLWISLRLDQLQKQVVTMLEDEAMKGTGELVFWMQLFVWFGI